MIIRHTSSTSSIYYDPPCSICMLDSPFPQPLSRSSLVFLYVLDPLLHTPCISSPNHHLLFAAHAHTITGCSAVIPMLCYLFLTPPLSSCLEICLSLMPHIHMAILISARQMPPHFLSLRARSHFHATRCFSHNCCTTFLS